jgi:hypothetical protein
MNHIRATTNAHAALHLRDGYSAQMLCGRVVLRGVVVRDWEGRRICRECARAEARRGLARGEAKK